VKLFVCSNLYKEEQIRQARDCITVLEKSGHSCFVSEKDNGILFKDSKHIGSGVGDCDLVVSIGGDGRVLRAAHLGLEANKAVIGINSGRKGYLCALNIEDADTFNDVLKTCRKTERMLLELEYDGKTYYALNDVYVTKQNFGKTVDLTVQVNQGETLKIRADGVIISTPTGSTAYNASADGPVLDENSGTVALTPVCPNDAMNHSVVYKDDSSFRIEERNDTAMIYTDGEFVANLSKAVVVKKSSKTLVLYSGNQKKY